MRRAGLTDLTAFMAVAEHRSFRAAAIALSVSPSALSHAMRGLEARVGVRLLNRTTRSVALSESGERLLGRLRPAMQTIDEALAELGETSDRLKGRIRINAMENGAMALLRSVVIFFVKNHPDVEIDIVTEGAMVDIVAGGFDAGVRLLEAVPRDMVTVPIGPESGFAAVASPNYLAKGHVPMTPADLLEHRCIRFRFVSGAIYRWEFEKRGQSVAIDPPGSLTLDNMNVVVEAALQGAGIALVWRQQVVDHIAGGRLVRLLEDWTPSFPGLHLYYPKNPHLPKAFTEFLNHLRGEQTIIRS
ncbi:MAG: LysR family transcriptional regulator [Gemmatimonadaceae bacterium]|nr:LysR family transcriptional regulator [Acetobacteraceae bacterium]